MLKTLLTDTQATVTTADMKARILRDEQCCIVESGGTAAMFFARAGKKAQRSERHEKLVERPTNNKNCAHCKLGGHDILECRKLKKALEDTKSSTREPSHQEKPEFQICLNLSKYEQI